MIFVLAAMVPVLCLDRYQAVGDPLIAEEFVDHMLNGWEIKSSTVGNVDLHNSVLQLMAVDPSRTVSVQQRFPVQQGLSLVALKGTVAVKDVVAGEKPWHTARLLLVQYTGDKPRWDVPHAVVSLIGEKSWKEYKSLFLIAPNTDQIRVIVQLSHSTGSFLVSDLSLTEVKQAGWYNWVKAFVLAGVFTFIGYLLAPYIDWSLAKGLSWLVLCFALILIVGTAMPGKVKTSMKKGVGNSVNSMVSSASLVLQGGDHMIDAEQSSMEKMRGIDSTKAAHFILFAVLGCLLVLCRPDRSLYLIMLDLLLLAATTELLQLYIDGRSALLTDVLIDGAGALFGCSCARLRPKRLGPVDIVGN